MRGPDNPASHETHLFQASVADVATAARQLSWLLTPDERRQFDQYRSASRRLSLLAGRVLVRCVLAEFTGVSPDAVEIWRDCNGRPYLGEHPQGGSDPADCVNFNISHSADQLVIAITSGVPVGVDVENRERPVKHHVLLGQYFTDSEQDRWIRRHSAAEPLDFLRGWTRKEAAWKVFGNPQRLSWRDIEVSWSPEQRTSVDVALAAPTGISSERWDCWTWHPTPTSVASAVVRTTGDTVPVFLCRSIGLSSTGQLV